MFKKDINELLVGDVIDILVGKPAVVKKDALLKDAVEAITNNKTSWKVYVVDESYKLIGVITIETLLRQVGYLVGVRETGMISFFKFLSGVFKENVVDFMEKPVRINKRHKILEALKMMVEYHLNDLPIIDDDERLIGELHSLEILKYAKNIFEKE